LDKMEACKGRQKYVLNRMVDEGFINAREAEAAYAEDLQLIPYKKKVDRDAENRLPPEIRAPVMKQLDASLQARYGDEWEQAKLRGGLQVHTTFDHELM